MPKSNDMIASLDAIKAQIEDKPDEHDGVNLAAAKLAALHTADQLRNQLAMLTKLLA